MVDTNTPSPVPYTRGRYGVCMDIVDTIRPIPMVCISRASGMYMHMLQYIYASATVCICR